HSTDIARANANRHEHRGNRDQKSNHPARQFFERVDHLIGTGRLRVCWRCQTCSKHQSKEYGSQPLPHSRISFAHVVVHLHVLHLHLLRLALLHLIQLNFVLAFGDEFKDHREIRFRAAHWFISNPFYSTFPLQRLLRDRRNALGCIPRLTRISHSVSDILFAPHELSRSLRSTSRTSRLPHSIAASHIHPIASRWVRRQIAFAEAAQGYAAAREENS